MSESRRKKVQVWVYRRSETGPWEVLILRLVPERGGFWQPITGGVEEGEALVDAALREATEETALPFLGASRDLHVSFTYENARGRFEEHGFALETGSGDVRLDPFEHDDYAWVSFEEAAQRVHHASNRDVLHMLEFLLERP